jgi:hypothetical protein
MLQVKEHTPTHFSSIFFTFGLIVKSIKEFRIVFTIVAAPLWPSVRMKLTLPKVRDLESFGTLENSELDCRIQNTLH